jgi:hypothetical protein
MARIFVRLARIALVMGGGLWTAALPAHADMMWAFGETTSIEASGPTAAGGASAYYTSVNQGGGYFDVPPGINSTLTDPSSTLTYSPKPAPPGLSAVALNLSVDNSAANVSAAMATGATHMYASSIEDTTGCCVETLDALSLEMKDQLTFAVGGSGSDTISVGFSLDGNVNPGNVGAGSWSQTIEYNFGSPFLFWQSGSGFNSPTTAPTARWDTASFTGNSLTGFNFVGTLTVTNGEVVPISFIQQLNCNNGTVCDFSNTGQMSLILPSDVSYSSASGVFLTQGATATPEPSLRFLTGFGIVAIGYIGRRHLAGAKDR